MALKINFNTKHLSKVVFASLRALLPLVHSTNVQPLHRTMAGNAVKHNFNTKHFSKGDPLPPFTGKLRVYSMRYCPFAHRTILVLNAKQIDYDLVNIDLRNKPEWYLGKSQFGKVPAIEVEDGVCITESLIMSEYLDEAYPQRPLLPKDPVKKAHEKIMIESAAPLQQLLIKLVTAPDNVTDDMVASYKRFLSYFQDELKKKGTMFLAGVEPGFADYMIWPFFEKMVMYYADVNPVVKIDEEDYKKLWEYINNMFKDPSIRQYLVPKEALFAFLEAYKKGENPNYNLLTVE